MPRNRGKSVAVLGPWRAFNGTELSGCLPGSGLFNPKIKLVAEIKRGNWWKRAGTVLTSACA